MPCRSTHSTAPAPSRSCTAPDRPTRCVLSPPPREQSPHPRDRARDSREQSPQRALTRHHPPTLWVPRRPCGLRADLVGYAPTLWVTRRPCGTRSADKAQGRRTRHKVGGWRVPRRARVARGTDDLREDRQESRGEGRHEGRGEGRHESRSDRCHESQDESRSASPAPGDGEDQDEGEVRCTSWTGWPSGSSTNATVSRPSRNGCGPV